MAAHQEARRVLRSRLGRRGPPAERQDRPDQRRRQGRPRRPVERPGAGGRGRDRPDRRGHGADAAVHRADAGHARIEAVQRPGLAVRDQVGRVPRAGRRQRAGRSRPGPAASRTPRPISRGCCRRLRGSTPSRRSSMARSWPSTRTAARISRSSRRSSARRGSVASSISRSTCSISMAGSLLDVPLEDRKRLLQSVLKAHPRVRFASHIVGDGEAFFEAAGANQPGGHDRQAPTEPVRAGQAIQGLAEVEGPARAGAGHRRLDAGRGQRPGSRRAGGGLLRGRQAEVRRQGRVGLHRRGPQGAARRSSSRSRSTTRRTTNRRRRTTRADGAAIWGR